VAGGFQAGGQRVGHAHAHAVQAAREAVGPALALVELAARVQAGEHQFDHRRLFLGVQAEGNAPAVVLDADRAIGMQRDLDLFAVAGQGLVGGVVQHLLDDVQGLSVRVYMPGRCLTGSRPLSTRIEPSEYSDAETGLTAMGADCSAV
jgi:hypothetical protein